MAGAVRDSRDIGEVAEVIKSMQEAFCIGDTEFIRHDPTMVWLLCQILLTSLTMNGEAWFLRQMRLHSVS